MDTKQYKHLHKILQKLRSYRKHASPILSVYLGNPFGNKGDKLAGSFLAMVKKLPHKQKKLVKNEIEIIRAYLLSSYDAKSHALPIAFFAGKGVWEIVYHNFPIPDLCNLSYSPNILPLEEEIKKDSRYLFVIADREKAKLITFLYGQVESSKEVIDASVPQKIKAKKEILGRETHMLNYIRNHMHHHLQKISKAVEKFIEKKQIAAVFIGGHKVLFREIEKHLPEDLQKKTKGTFVSDVNISFPLLAKHCRKVLDKTYEKKYYFA